MVSANTYGSLLKRQRRELHRRTAEWFADDAVLYAQHLDHAGSDRAPRAYLAAAQQQARQYRYESALNLIDRGLNSGPQQPDRHPLACLKGVLLLDMAEAESALRVYREVEEHASNDEEVCDAWMGMAACKRITTEYEGGVELLKKCEPIAFAHYSALQLSRFHHLRGNLYFPLGNSEGCREEHQRALECAREAGSAEAEARALGGLGDAEYARGRNRSAFDALESCVERCREHGFGRIEVANLSQMVQSEVSLGRRQDLLVHALQAAEAAARVSHHRAEMNAWSAVSHAAFELGDIDRCEASARRGLELAKKLGARLGGKFPNLLVEELVPPG